MSSLWSGNKKTDICSDVVIRGTFCAQSMKYCSQEGEDEIENLLNGGIQFTIDAPQDVGAGGCYSSLRQSHADRH